MRRCCVLARGPIPPYFEHFQQHAPAIANWMNAAALLMCPPHRDLYHFQTFLLSQENQLRIEPPELNFLQRKDSIRRTPAESLEPALGVLEPQPECKTKRQIEETPKELTMQRLLLGLQFRPYPTRTDGYVRSRLNLLEQLRSLLDWCREIGVAE